MFRSVWLVGIGSLPSAISLLMVLGGLGFAHATLSAAATASAAMLFGLGIDGVVLLYVAYTHALDGGVDPDAAIDSLTGSSYSMLLGMWTTAATFYGLVFVDFPSLEQLGRLIGHSMVLCGLLTLVLVPATLPRRRRKRRARSLALPGLSAWVTRHRVAILAGATVVTVVLGVAASRLRIDPTLDRLKSVTPAAVLQEAIAPMFGLPTEVYVVLDEGPELQPLLVSNERLVAEIARTQPDLLLQPATALLPSEATQARRAQIVSGSRGDCRGGRRCAGRRPREAAGLPPRLVRSVSRAAAPPARQPASPDFRRISCARPRRPGRAIRSAESDRRMADRVVRLPDEPPRR